MASSQDPLGLLSRNLVSLKSSQDRSLSNLYLFWLLTSPYRLECSSITIFWWNTLSQALSLPSETFPNPPFPHSSSRLRRGCSALTFALADPAVLTWEYRSLRILSVIVEHNPSIIGLCEVDGKVFSE